MGNQTFYYFFSTVPQVVAAIVAFIGAFHIFRNENIIKELIGYSQNVIDACKKLNKDYYDQLEEARQAMNKRIIEDKLDKELLPESKFKQNIDFIIEKLTKHQISRNTKEIVKIAKREIKDENGEEIEVEVLEAKLTDNFYNNLKNIIETSKRKNEILNSFYWLISASMLTIMLSMTILAFIDGGTNICTLNILYIITIILLAVNLFLVVRYIRE